MRRGPVHAMAWVLATAAAVTLSWWGVHTVMSGTAYDPPRAVPLTARAPEAAPPSPSAGGTGPAPAPSDPSSASPSASPSPSASAAAGASPSPPAKPKQAPAPGQRPYPEGGQGGGSGTVKSYAVSGGRVVFDLGAASAALVSATPDAGWRMQVWKQDFWIRVTFTQGSREVSVFCTWHDHPPVVETVDP
ncbi:hypothetical protein ACIPW5_19000 [Streptomyces sp. NPDC090077]|uniref:hypothetical protein n=1 Tax=Streptomyces sp. NPDC090077 TaxID=3365938 RepID=UPI0037F329EC